MEAFQKRVSRVMLSFGNRGRILGFPRGKRARNTHKDGSDDPVMPGLLADNTGNPPSELKSANTRDGQTTCAQIQSDRLELTKRAIQAKSRMTR